LVRLITQAGVPDGAVNLLTGYGHTAGAAITAHRDVEKVAFTGSTEIGKEIVRASAGNLKKVMLELGGKSPVLIYDDADVDKAILMASMGIFVHSGQGCVCGSRILVQRGVYDQVVEGVANMANFIKLGGPDEEGCVSGPLISAKQLTQVMGFIDEGRSDGVEVVTGGHRLDRKGYFVHPTVLTNVNRDMRRNIVCSGGSWNIITPGGMSNSHCTNSRMSLRLLENVSQFDSALSTSAWRDSAQKS
jgi:aldehyde dehydrogenase (NAD+)